MTAHSPGPWRWEDFRKDDGTWHLRDADGDSVLRVRDVGEAFSMPGQAEPDARLIAAAPELLEVALMAAADWCGRRRLTSVPCPDPACLPCRAFAVVARIDGKQPDDAKTDK